MLPVLSYVKTRHCGVSPWCPPDTWTDTAAQCVDPAASFHKVAFNCALFGNVVTPVTLAPCSLPPQEGKDFLRPAGVSGWLMLQNNGEGDNKKSSSSFFELLTADASGCASFRERERKTPLKNENTRPYPQNPQGQRGGITLTLLGGLLPSLPVSPMSVLGVKLSSKQVNPRMERRPRLYL